MPAGIWVAVCAGGTLGPHLPALPSALGDGVFDDRRDGAVVVDSGFLSQYSRCRGVLTRRVCAAGAVLVALTARADAADSTRQRRFARPILFAQLPAGSDAERGGPLAGGMLRARYGDGARLVLLSPDGSAEVISRGFHSACDPDVSFSGKRVLFAGRRNASDRWNIYEISLEGREVRQITQEAGNCRSPSYQSTLYTIVSPKPWYQLTFVSDAAGTANEGASVAATHLYSCKVDGSGLRRLTFNLSSDFDPFLMEDGRVLFAGWQRRTLDRGLRGRIALFAVNLDGTDHALFAGGQRPAVRHMPCTTADGLVVFVEAHRVAWDGAGWLGCVELRRPLHSYRQITGPEEGLFHGPAPSPDGAVLVSYRPAEGRGTHAIYWLDPTTGRKELVFDDPQFHEMQPRVIQTRDVPDGRSSVVTKTDPHGKLYCLTVYITDLARRESLPPGTVKRLRVLEGVPLPGVQADDPGRASRQPGEGRLRGTSSGPPPLAQRRMLGEIDVEAGGAFNLKVPANTPIELQILDADGLSLRSCGWIWARNHEPRGCIGCHEDGELTPENVLVEALERASVPLVLPPQRRRTVDFRRDVLPIIRKKCVVCHDPGQAPPRLDGRRERTAKAAPGTSFHRAYENLLATDGKTPGGDHRWKYVHPGRARTSPLVWHLLGRNTSRPWDGQPASAAAKGIPPGHAPAISADEIRTFTEWIDLGALWDGIPGEDEPVGRASDGANGRPAR